MQKTLYKCEKLYTKIFVDVIDQNQKTFDKFRVRSGNYRKNLNLTKLDSKFAMSILQKHQIIGKNHDLLMFWGPLTHFIQHFAAFF